VTKSAPAPAPQPLLRHPWRIAIIAAVLVAVVNLGILLLDESDTSDIGVTLPQGIEALFPGQGEILQDEVTVDLENDLTGVLMFDGAEIPEDQLTRVEDLGQVSFRPGPGKDIVKFAPGTHEAIVLYWENGKDRPDEPDAYRWTFKAVN
jgi:hypothetical protein